MKTLEYRDTELSVRIPLQKLLGKKERFFYDLIDLFEKYRLDEEKLDMLMVLDERRPYDEDIMYSIGETRRFSGAITEMESWFNKIREITNEHDFHLLLRSGEAFIFGGGDIKSLKKGVSYLESARLIEPKNKDVLYGLVEGCMKIRDADHEVKAKKYIDAYLKLDPGNEDMLSWLEELEG